MWRGPLAYGHATADRTLLMRWSLEGCATQLSGRHFRRSSPVGSGEVGVLVAGSLELEEPGGPGDEQDAVPQLAGVLALRGRGHDRSEERHALDADHRCSDVHADLVHAGVV